ncbi:hypothetical protein E1B06_14755 [Brevibacillus laterosporus]|uniref:hypothetical protein n=1 Tax=Brevibacillus laterosporus TaxID=1465 RepID=UPI0024063953|nr:hypothetical protein [Brevibacillus laterosporus]MDF9412943.1 hypothetical protein [Brevibacillus laterosporus]
MPTLTPRLGIKKPLGNENVLRAPFNENWDIIDTKVATQADFGKHAGAGGTAHSLATNKLAGFMSPEDKDALGSCNKYRSGYDSTSQIYTVVNYKREDGTDYMTSVLSNKVGNVYTVETRQYYGPDGKTIGKREVYDITYDSNGNPVNEVKRK